MLWIIEVIDELGRQLHIARLEPERVLERHWTRRLIGHIECLLRLARDDQTHFGGLVPCLIRRGPHPHDVFAGGSHLGTHRDSPVGGQYSVRPAVSSSLQILCLVAALERDRFRGADRLVHDPLRCGQIFFEQDRRYRKDVTDIVKSIPGIVRREISRRLEADADQIAYRVIVLLPVEPADRNPSRIRV